MARIRTVKPEFWSDEKVAQLSEGCMAFFIGLWNFCDDEGKCENNARQLSLRMPVFRTKDILTWLSRLSELGLIRFSHDSQWLLVTNWNHQKIDRPRLPKVKAAEIQWLPIPDSTKPRESSSIVRRKDRIGKDRIGKDRIPVGERSAKKPKTEPSQTSLEIVNAGPPAAGAKPTVDPFVQKVVGRFYDLWKNRHGGRAPLDPADHKKLKRLVENFGGEKALQFVDAYFAIPDSWFETKSHDVESLMKNLAKVERFISTGTTITRRDADSIESAQALTNQIQRLGGAV